MLWTLLNSWLINKFYLAAEMEEFESEELEIDLAQSSGNFNNFIKLYIKFIIHYKWYNIDFYCYLNS